MTSHVLALPSEIRTDPSWMATLEVFGVPFLTYAPDGLRVHVSHSASTLMQRLPAGHQLGEQADRLVADMIGSSHKEFELRRIALVREVAGCVRGVMLGLHVVRPAMGGVCAVVVLRPCDPAPASDPRRFGLTPRESLVAQLIAAGLATKQIAHRLGVSPHTARHHTERVFAKLGVRTRAGAAAVVGAHFDTGTIVR